MNTKGTLNDVNEELENFLNYVDRGIVAGTFVFELDNAVKIVKSSRRARLNFMIYQMNLLESRMEGEEIGTEIGKEIGKKMATLENLKSVMENFHVSLNEAMEVLKVPSDKRDYYSSVINS